MKIKDIMQSKISHSQRNDKYCMIHLYETLEVIEKNHRNRQQGLVRTRQIEGSSYLMGINFHLMSLMRQKAFQRWSGDGHIAG